MKYIIEDITNLTGVPEYVLEKFLWYDAARDLEQFIFDHDIQEQFDKLSDEFDRLEEDYDDLCNDLDDARSSVDSLEEDLAELRTRLTSLSITPISDVNRDELFKMLGIFVDKDYTKDIIIQEFENRFKSEVDEIL